MKKLVIVAALLAPLAPLPVLAQTAPPPTNPAAAAKPAEQLPPAIAQLGAAVSRKMNDVGTATSAMQNIPSDGQEVLQKWQAMLQWAQSEQQQLDAVKKNQDELAKLRAENDRLHQQLDAAHRTAAPSGPQSFPQSTPRR